MTPVEKRYHQAAVVYLIYGLIYLCGAIYLSQIGETVRGMESGGIWWFVVGALMAFGLPVFIWKGYKWITRILAVLVFIRVIGLLRLVIYQPLEQIALPGGAEMPKAYGAAAFAAVAAVACAFLVRAAWPRHYFRAETDEPVRPS